MLKWTSGLVFLGSFAACDAAAAVPSSVETIAPNLLLGAGAGFSGHLCRVNRLFHTSLVIC